MRWGLLVYRAITGGLPEVMERMTLRVYAKVMQSRAAEVNVALDTFFSGTQRATKSAAEKAWRLPDGTISLIERSG
jgi:hypothetical protein